MSDPENAAQARRALGQELAAYRAASGHTQTRFAALTGYSRSTVANVETGRQRVPRDFWERCDSALRTGGVLATGNDDLEARTRQDLRVAAREVSKARRARTWPGTEEPGPVRMGGPREPRHSADPPWPEGTGTQAHNAEIPEIPGLPSANELTAGCSRFRRITPGDLARLRGMRAHLKSIDNAHGGGTALPLITWYLRHEVLPLLEEGRGDPHARAMTEVVAEAELDVGWAAYDAGQQPLATRYFSEALQLSRAAGNRLLGGRILSAMSHQAIYLGNRSQAIDLAQAARKLTLYIATPRMTAMEAAMEACAHAAAGDARGCHRALGDAADAVALIARGQSDPEWLDFDEGGYWGHAARAYRDLGEARRAEECAAKSVGLCLAPHSRTRAQRSTIQATAHLHMGEIDAAAAAAEQVVREAWNLNSRHVFGEVAALIAAIEPFRTATANDFLEQGRELLTARAPGSASGAAL